MLITKTEQLISNNKLILSLNCNNNFEYLLDLDKRLLLLDRKIKENAFYHNPIPKNEYSQFKPGQAIKISGEFLSAILVGTILGIGFDRLTNLSPWGLVIFLFLGFIAGIINIIRTL